MGQASQPSLYVGLDPNWIMTFEDLGELNTFLGLKLLDQKNRFTYVRRNLH